MRFDNLQYDALTMIDTHAVRQRYSAARDSFVTLSHLDGVYVLRDERTSSEHTLAAGFTDAPRLIAHWTQFCRTHRVDR
jgi:hypothetical protein